jgi:hypothetical protein
MRNTQLARKCFAAFEFSEVPRTAHRQRTLPSPDNCLMRRSNPSRPDRRSMLVALKAFDLLDFATATQRQKGSAWR